MENTGPTVIGVTMMFEAVAVVAMLFRFWSQQMTKRKLHIHDILIAFGFICATALATCVACSVRYGGLGKHFIDVQPTEVTVYKKLIISIHGLWVLSMTPIRASILCLYLQIFGASRIFKISCNIMIAVCVLWAVGNILALFLLCRPFKYNWDQSIEGHCGSASAAYLSIHSLNFAIDIIIALLPTPILARLHMPLSRKIGISLMFAQGALICAISAARIVLFKIAVANKDTDFTYNGSLSYLFTGLEPLIACTLACMPLMRPVSERFAQSRPASWAKSLLRSTRGTLVPSSNVSGYLRRAGSDSGIQEGPHYEADAIAGNGKPRTGESSSDDEPGIRVSYTYEQRTYEMVSVHQV